MKKHLILCPVDFSDSTEPAIRLAANLAQANKSKIVLLHVIDPNEKAMNMEDLQITQFQERVRDQYLVKNDVEFEHFIRHGDPADVAVEFAKQHAVDIIVMGTHGRTGLAGMVVGSVAKNVLAHASCPVVTVKMPSQSKNKSPRQPSSATPS